MSEEISHEKPYGVLAVFATADALVAAAEHLHSLGLREVQAHAPYPVPAIERLWAERLPWRRRILPAFIFLGAVFGVFYGYFIQYWDAVLSYPINVGGHPLNSWPAFIVSTVEFGMLCALAAASFGLIVSCGLPRLYHPLFEAAAFDTASRDRFVLSVEAGDPNFEVNLVLRVFDRFGAEHIEEIPS